VSAGEQRAGHGGATGDGTRATADIVLALQRSLLPAAVPVLPRVRLAAQYEAAADELRAGGDWFDAFPTGNGKVALIVGDVVGHGAAAAATMAQLRTVLQEALLSGTPMTEAVDRLDRFAAAIPGARSATVCVAELDSAAGALTWISRAHPPPLVCSPGGATRFLRDGRGLALGIGGGHAQVAAGKVAADEVVLLYSNGLVERSGETIDTGLDRLARAAARAVSGDRDRISGLTVQHLAGAEHTDDVTILAAHLLPDATPPLFFRVAAEPGQLSGLRELVSTWVTRFAADHDDHIAVCLAAYEAAANVVDHAYRGRPPGELRLTASLGDDGAVTLVVADDGRWRAPDRTRGGRGLPLIRACTDLTLDQHDDGTTATMRRHLTRPAVIGSTRSAAQDSAPDAAPFSAAVTRYDPTVITARGTVDAGTVGLLSTEIAKHCTAPLVIDLALVTFLASVGVQLLYDLTTRHDIRLHAPAGSPAREVLNLVGLSDLLITG
jgi:anti-sigma regulatory factor (Ser/Thr protein kinase)